MTGGENGRGGEIPGCQRGSGTVLVAVVVMVVMAITAALIVVTGYVSAAHAVRGAADLVALPGAAGHAKVEATALMLDVRRRPTGSVSPRARWRGTVGTSWCR